MTKGLLVSNADISDVLERIADLLQVQNADAFRVKAYRDAAENVRETDLPLRAILEADGAQGLERIPGVGKSISSVIQEYLRTGRVLMLERLEGQVSPEDLFTTVPGIGDMLAHNIHDELDIETLEELELAANDGRLAEVTGFGIRRVQGIKETLAGMLGRSSRRRARRARWLENAPDDVSVERPSVEAILSVDTEYRQKANAGQLRTIVPRRFNPERRAWLPILHAERLGWSYTALYSNTARAHQLGMTHDWVVLYYERDGHEDQCTVVTERSGPLKGKRVVRGRNAECIEYYSRRKAIRDSDPPSRLAKAS